MTTTVRNLTLQLSETKKLCEAAMDEYNAASAAQDVVQEKVKAAMCKMADLIEAVDELKAQLNSAMRKPDYQDAVIAMKAIRAVIYSRGDWLGSLGTAFRDLCNSYCWCVQCSFDACEPRFPSRICSDH